MNIAVIGGDSAYNKRHGVEFDGPAILYGCLVDSRSPNVVLKKVAKFGATSMPGIFIGYTQHVGGKWAHDYFVCPLKGFQMESAPHTCLIFRVRGAIPDCSKVDQYSTGFIFPLCCQGPHDKNLRSSR